MKYRANERNWVMRLLARLTDDERTEYEKRMRAATGHFRTGKKYDGQKARIAEQVMYEFRVAKKETTP